MITGKLSCKYERIQFPTAIQSFVIPLDGHSRGTFAKPKCMSLKGKCYATNRGRLPRRLQWAAIYPANCHRPAWPFVDGADVLSAPLRRVLICSRTN